MDATAKNGKVTCDCVNYTTLKICAHALAGARFCDSLQKFSVFHNNYSGPPRLDAVVEHKLPSTVGQKKVKKTQQRLGTATPNPPIMSIATPSGILSRTSVPSAGSARKTAVKPDAYTVELHFLSSCNHKVSTCYGCKKDIKHPTADPFSPFDLVAASHMQRKFFDVKDKKEKDGVAGNAYFHLRLDCIR